VKIDDRLGTALRNRIRLACRGVILRQQFHDSGGLQQSTDDEYSALRRNSVVLYWKRTVLEGKMVTWTIFVASFAATMKSLIVGGSPFAGFTALWPTNDDGKYVIEAEGIRIAFTNRNGGAPTNLWITDKNGKEVDIILGLDKVEEYENYLGQLGGTIGELQAPINHGISIHARQGGWLDTSAMHNSRSTEPRTLPQPTATMARQLSTEARKGGSA
jgi:hypothetical protein